MADKNLAAAAFVLSFFLVAVPLSSAVNQPATETPAFELYPGENATMNLVYFSDRNFSTYLDFAAFGPGSELLTFAPYLPLPAGGVVYLPVKVSVPSNFTGTADFHVTMGVIQTQIVDPSSDEVIDSKAREIRVVVKQRSTSSGTSSSTTSSDSTSVSNTVSSNTSSTSSNASSGTAAGSVTSNATSTAVTASPQTASNATSAAVTEQKSAIIVFPKQARDDGDDDKRKLAKKAAKYIEKLRGEGKSKGTGPSERYEFEIVPARSNVTVTVPAPSVVNVGLEIARNLSDVGVVVNTLEIEDETTGSGVVSTPVEISGVEDSENRTIEIGSRSMPDVQQRAVREEVVRTTPAGEVVRKITKKKAYKYLEIDVEGAASSDVSNAQIEFVVEKSWLAENGVSYSEVRLNRLVGEDWVELPTRMESEGADSYKFVAESPGFSFFVITAAITADVLTPISIEVPTVEADTGQSDLAGDILGTTKPQPLVILNFSWTLIVVVLGIIVMWKWNDIKRAMGFVHAKENRARELEAEKARYQRMKEETTKKYYKRSIGETEFNNLVVEYDRNIIRIETELADLGRKPEKKA